MSSPVHFNLTTYKYAGAFIITALVFFWMTYYSVSPIAPNSLPVHHDDYSNYSLGALPFEWSWIRPLSTWVIHFLSTLGPDYLIWAVRLLTILYVFFAWKIINELIDTRHYLLTTGVFAIAALSTPIIAEYARYTGMITHTLSGCLGLMAAYLLFVDSRKQGNAYLYLSALLLILSALAKEDFILFYIFTLVYLLLKTAKPVARRAAIGIGAVLISLAVVAGAKFIAASSFLGETNTQSSYFIDISPVGITRTVIHYLLGASHPAMLQHGYVILGAFIFCAFGALVLCIRERNLAKTLYPIGAALTIMAPYSVLPNHVNAYYEIIWTPFIVGGVYTTVVEMSKGLTTTRRELFSLITLAILAAVLYGTDTPGRKSIASWYDNVAGANRLSFEQLLSSKTAINTSPITCILGASPFSPWYMHSSRYLSFVLDLHTVWYISLDANSPYYPGMEQGAAASNGKVVIKPTVPPTDCLTIRLGDNT